MSLRDNPQYTIGRIESAIGLTGDHELFEVVRAVEALVEERDQLRLDARHARRMAAEAREDQLRERERREAAEKGGQP